MISPSTIETIQKAPIEDRLRVIELILHSLKSEIKSTKKAKKTSKPFRVRQFDLGQEVHVDRDELYSERGL